MAIVKHVILYAVNIVEYERGWDSRVEDTIYFDNELEAKNFAVDYNKKHNTAMVVPDWYMVAEYIGAR